MRGRVLAVAFSAAVLTVVAGVAPAAAAPPEVLGGPHTPVGAAEVVVRGHVNPEGLAISDCHFAWGATSSYGQSVPCEQSVPADGQEHLVSARIGGLSPSTTYHAALVVTTADGTDAGADFPFRTLAAPSDRTCPNADRPGAEHLPDCRAWEMVSPLDKNGGEVLADTNRVQAAVGESPGLPMAVGFSSLSGFGDIAGTSIASDYLAQRSTDPDPGNQGWTTHGVIPPQPQQTYLAALVGSEGHYEIFNPDLTLGLLSFPSPVPTADGPHPNVDLLVNQYRREDLRSPGLGTYRLLSDAPTSIQTEGDLINAIANAFSSAEYSGATPDFQHVLFRSYAPHTADAPPFEMTAHPGIYEWENGIERLVSRVPSAGASCDDAGGTPCEPASDATTGENGVAGQYVRTVISRDGNRVFFRAQCSSGPCGLYVRIAHRETVRIDVSERTDCAEDPTCGGDGVPDPVSDPMAPGQAAFGAAGADGMKAFFTSPDALTDDAPSNGKKLYMYDAHKPPSAPDNLTYVSRGVEGEDAVEGVIGVSDDGNSVYFVDGVQPVSGAPMFTQGETLGIFLWRPDGSADGSLSYVGASGVSDHNFNIPHGVALSPLASRVSPDGSHLLFMSTNGKDLTGYDHTCQSGGCEEFYLYDRDASSPTSAQLTCASCNPTGAPPQTNAAVRVRNKTGGSTTTRRTNNALSADGRYVFFSSGDALVPSDTNGAYDAYEFDSVTGRLHLLSSGESSGDSFFMEATPDGHDAFFTTQEGLSGWDQGTAGDLYDARIDGGFPEPPLRPVSCQGDACQPPPSALNDPTPASAVFRGAGNKVRNCKVKKARAKGKKKRTRQSCQRKKHRKKHHRKHTKRQRTSDHRRGA